MEVNATGGIFNLRPPRLEDAGIEDCALPADSIQEALRRAADAVKKMSSTATGVLGAKFAGESDVQCTHNPGPTNGSWEDRCLGSTGISSLGQESCVEPKAGGLIEEGHDVVVLGGGDVQGDRLVVGVESGPGVGKRGCTENDVDHGHDPEPKEQENGLGPILIGAVF